MIFGAKKDIRRKEHVGLYTVVDYKGTTQVYYCGAYKFKTDKSFEEQVNELRKEQR